jgi:putative SOS response-associated peptidase YedK
MCGRFSQTASPEVIAQQFALDDPPLFKARYNIAPSQQIAAIRIEPDTATRKLVMLHWGLIPSWAKAPCGISRVRAGASPVICPCDQGKHLVDCHPPECAMHLALSWNVS